ncbi:bone morphogenetic protein 2-like [Onthophagus taurus]|uniref:bone morphogenetic protein 2-like n=1 Tax=Onthophagus taurus TaxID=166361 RepID=UPI000C206997|nr:bone morphogenetic protein 2-like [Onthophagus taurus]
MYVLIIFLICFGTILENKLVDGEENITKIQTEPEIIHQKTEEGEKIKNGRTYLFKATKLNVADEPAPIYRNIMQNQNNYQDFEAEMLRKSGKRNYLRMERFKNAHSSYLIDPEWTFDSMNQFVEIPEIANELYDDMVEKVEEFDNISTIRLVFERGHSNNILKFDLFPLNEGDEVLDAELHIYRFSELNETNSQQQTKQTDEIMRLYQLINLNNSNINENMTENPDIHKLLNVIYVSSSYSGWQIFKVQNVIQNWLKSEPNLGFLLTCTDSSDVPLQLNIARKSNQKFQPILVIYVKKKFSRNHAKISHLNKRLNRNRIFQNSLDFKTINRLPLTTSGCNKQIWYISFQEMGWNNFILAPDGFMAFQCRGSCISTISSSPTTTNHGLLKHLFHSFVYVKKPCCVPDTYKSLVIMFLDRFQNVIIKNYDDMIVDSCACR